MIPPSPPADAGLLLQEPLAWLADQAHENLGTELALRGAAPGPSTGSPVVITRWRRAITGVAVARPDGQWFVEAAAPDATEMPVEWTWALAEPSKVTASGTVKGWLRPRLVGRARIMREHDQLAMACSAPPPGAEGRWAGLDDREALERYQAAYNPERRTSIHPDWAALLSRPAVAVLERDGAIAAVIKRTADTARYATVGGTFTVPSRRRQGLARRLTAFIVAALLAERPAVHLVVDDDNAAAIALYRSLGFVETGRCWIAYLQSAGDPRHNCHTG